MTVLAIVAALYKIERVLYFRVKKIDFFSRICYNTCVC
nr:MAG TPA: hypothetical protein [Caudoviricetes sp.]